MCIRVICFITHQWSSYQYYYDDDIFVQAPMLLVDVCQVVELAQS